VNANLLGKDGKWHLIESSQVTLVAFNLLPLGQHSVRLIFDGGAVLELAMTRQALISAISHAQHQIAIPESE